ncbi:MAG: pseudouridine synthase, partial [Patescibacteria group bacterium]
MEPKIIFEDDSMFVIDKPSGWITNDASTTTTQPVIQTWVRENFDYPLKGDREMRDGVVHRLDKETSGLLLIGKPKDAFEKLQAEFKGREVEKVYV